MRTLGEGVPVYLLVAGMISFKCLRFPRIDRLKIGDLFEIAGVAGDEFEVVSDSNGGNLRILDTYGPTELGAG